MNEEYKIEQPVKTNSIEEDVTFNDTKDNLYIVEKHNKKPGLDLEEGKYKITGVVTSKNMYKRENKVKNSNSGVVPRIGNVVISFGYRVEEVSTGKTMLVTKKQGIDLCRLYGMVNSFIISKTNEKKDSEGKVIKTKPIMYLQPYPSNLECFTKDERVINIFELDEHYKVVEPLKLTVKEEETTPEMWKLIQNEYEKMEEKLQKNSQNSTKREHISIINSLRAELKRTAIEDVELDITGIIKKQTGEG